MSLKKTDTYVRGNKSHLAEAAISSDNGGRYGRKKNG